MNFNKNKILLPKYDVNFSKFKFRRDLKKLLLKKNKSLGRSSGTIVNWHKGGGVKRNFRILSDPNKHFFCNFAILRSIEYDPNRSAFIGLIQYENGAFANIIVSSMMKIGEIIGLFNKITDIRKNGDILRLKYAPIGLPIYNLEKFPGSGPIYSKAAGVCSKLLTKDLKYGKVKLSSGEERLFDLNCTLTLGIPSNIYNQFNKKYKAGTNRLLNRRPVVRGVAMNPIDHPHGGGAGKTAPGRPSVSP
jgi:large subunit ribosomal protein L2